MKRIGVLATLLSVVLTAKLGTIQFNDHRETWYDLPMDRVIQNAQNAGISCDYWIRDDGVKMFGSWAIIAAHPSKTRYTFVETSLGTGIILDYHNVDEKNLYDIATDWR